MSDLADKIRELETFERFDGELFVSREVVLGLVGVDIENRKSQLEATLACEKKDCERALLALAGWYPTPVEGYGYNTSWAISDLCKAIPQVKLEAMAKIKKHFPLLGDFCNVIGCEECDWKPSKILQSRAQYIEHIAALGAAAERQMKRGSEC